MPLDAEGLRRAKRLKNLRLTLARKRGMTGELAWCSTCKQWLPVEQFGADSSRADGRRRVCRSCNTATSGAWHRANRDRINARERAMGQVRTEQKRRSRAARG